MCTWRCHRCGETVSSAFMRNLHLLTKEHQDFMCPYRNLPLEDLPLDDGDKKFLEELKVGW
jgi:hypothetical protein